MNKTLLLIICDFLLLNLLALTRWEKVEPVESRRNPVPEMNANASRPQESDLVAAMQQALEDEQTQRERLRQTLQSDVHSREAAMAKLEQQNRQLETSVEQMRKQSKEASERTSVNARQAEELRSQVEKARKDAETGRVELERRQREAAETHRAMESEKQKLAAERNHLVETVSIQKNELQNKDQNLLNLEAEKRLVEQRANKLAAAVQVSEAEKVLLRGSVDDLKREVATVRQEKAQVQAQTDTLSAGVSQLAERSGELRREIRENTPINANLMFSEFLSNRVQISVSGLLQSSTKPTVKQRETATVLVSDGPNIIAVLHVNETPFTFNIPSIGMDQVVTRVARDNVPLNAGSIYAIGIDSRVMAIPVDPDQAANSGVKIFPICKNPFRFTEAVLVSRGGRYYGEVEFRLDPRIPDYVRMKNRLFNRLFGEFSPSAGDIVLSKSGEFLGIMVNNEYCAVVRSFAPMPGGMIESRLSRDEVRRRLEELRGRVERLAMPLR